MVQQPTRAIHSGNSEIRLSLSSVPADPAPSAEPERGRRVLRTLACHAVRPVEVYEDLTGATSKRRLPSRHRDFEVCRSRDHLDLLAPGLRLIGPYLDPVKMLGTRWAAAGNHAEVTGVGTDEINATTMLHVLFLFSVRYGVKKRLLIIGR